MAVLKPLTVLFVLLLFTVTIHEKQAEAGRICNALRRIGRCILRKDLRSDVRTPQLTVEEKYETEATDEEYQRYEDLRNKQTVMTSGELKRTTQKLKEIKKSLPLFDKNYLKDFQNILKERKIKVSNAVKLMQMYAVYTYTVSSGNVNRILRNIDRKLPIFHDQPQLLVEHFNPHMVLNETLTQAELIENYILTKPAEHTLYRWEKPYPGFEDKFSTVNTVITFPTFTSCTSLESGFTTAGLTTDPNVYKIKYTIQVSSGRMIADIADYPEQEEVLFPLGTQFKIKEYVKYDNGSYTISLEQYGTS